MQDPSKREPVTEHRQIDRAKIDEKTIDLASQILQQGGLVVFPTDTVYGLGVNILNQEAVQRVYDIKQRSKTKPLPILISNSEKLSEYVKYIEPCAKKIMDAFWPGPLTMVFQCDKGPLSGRKVGFRIPDDAIANAIIDKACIPIACPSANLSGQPGSRTAHEVLRNFDGKIDLIIDAGPTKLGKESTVIEINRANDVKFLRNGYISQELIDTCINRPTLDKGKIKKVLFVCTGNSCRSVIAEGLFINMIKGKKPVHGLSAGTTAFPGIRPSENAIVATREEGVDISNHLSQTLTPDLISNVDLIIAMTKAHKRFILEISKNPELDSRKVFLLMEFASRWDFFGVDVEDPIGQPLWAYRSCLEMMKDPIQKLVNVL